MSNYKKAWNDSEIAQARNAYDGGASLDAIADICGRAMGSVRALLYKLKLPLPAGGAMMAPSEHDGDQHFQRERQIEGDRAFKRAMLRARNKTGTGSERTVLLGVIKNDKPPRIVRHFDREPLGSMMGSSATMCTEVA